MIINATLARLLYRRHIGSAHFPAWLNWRLYTHLETIPEGTNVYAFTVGGRLCAIVGGTKEAIAEDKQVA